MPMMGRFFTKTLNSVKKRGWLRNGAIILVDTSVGALSVVGAYIAVFGYPAALATPSFGQMVAGFTLLCGLSFIVFGTHRGAWRYVSTHDVVTLFKASAAAIAVASSARRDSAVAAKPPRASPRAATVAVASNSKATVTSTRLKPRAFTAPRRRARPRRARAAAGRWGR